MDDIDALVNSIENASVSDNKSKKKKNKKKGGQESSDIKTENSNLENGTSVETVNGEGTQNKKKKNKKKSNNEEGSVGPSQPQKKKATVQSDPPTVPVSQLFPNGQFPIGQIMDHPVGQSDTTAKNRFNSE